MRLGFVSNENGFYLKKALITWAEKNNYQVIDYGVDNVTKKITNEELVKRTFQDIDEDKVDFLIFSSWSGAVFSIYANRHSKIRCVYSTNKEIIKLSRQHNNANAITFGEGQVSNQKAIKLLKLFLDTTFSTDERHQIRIDELCSLGSNL